MRRDDDYIRELLFEIEGSENLYFYAGLYLEHTYDELKRHTHAKWLCDAGLLMEEEDGVFRITNQGNDYISAIRDEGIWRATKVAAAKAGGVGLGVMKDIAVAFVRQKVADVTGLVI